VTGNLKGLETRWIGLIRRGVGCDRRRKLLRIDRNRKCRAKQEGRSKTLVESHGLIVLGEPGIVKP